MSYTVTASERNNESASTQETKALLYLMSFRQDSEDIFYYVIDFFNDVTGVDRAGSCGWDIQSKASNNLSQAVVGRYLVTLYKNYLSEFQFNSYILFANGFLPSILIDKDLREFNICNFTDKAQKAILKNLKEEALKKTYIDNSLITDANISDFLSKVTFVVADADKANYIKKIVKINPSILPSDDYLNRIFDQIRAKQSDKKNINTENVTINVLADFVRYNKHLTNHEVKMLVLSRLIHRSGIDKTPISFLSVLANHNELEQHEILEECQDCMARVMCDINNGVAYWSLFEDIYKYVSLYPMYNVDRIYSLLDANKINRVQFLNINSTKFFIALVKDGLQYD